MIGYYKLAYEINIRVGYKPFKYLYNMHLFANQNPTFIMCFCNSSYIIKRKSAE